MNKQVELLKADRDWWQAKALEALAEPESARAREFVEQVAHMLKEEEYGNHNEPASEDWIASMNMLIDQARGLLQERVR